MTFKTCVILAQITPISYHIEGFIKIEMMITLYVHIMLMDPQLFSLADKIEVRSVKILAG